MTDRVAFLRQTDLLADVDEPLFTQIAEEMDELELREGFVLFEGGEAGDAVYLVVRGRLSMQQEGVHFLARGEGECVGEFALVDPAPRSNTAVAQTDTLLLRWQRRHFDACLANHPEVANGILRILTRKLRQDIAIHVESAVKLEKRVKERTAELQQANKRLREIDTAKTDFFASMSHELRTPMTAIVGYVDNMLEGVTGELNDRQTEYLQRVKAGGTRLTHLVNDLLDLSRIDRGRTDLLDLDIGPLPVSDILSEALELLRPMAEAGDLRLTFEGEDVSAMADGDRLMQVVTNLAGNAIKFTDTGGEIHVSVKADGQGYVRTSVRDTGEGIPEQDLDRVFEQLYQVKREGEHHQGSGLGLAISRELVRLQSGTIWAESEVGVGSTFVFTLPEARREGPSLAQRS